ncbi:helix-turn-helix domain-containing protein [Mycobacteroides abscessus]|uniref:helix-turn-helix domain-containing protein n=1 Tax=Mycobacteroides abscessus TaxID=36809 RepID=UPI000C25A4C0|nr:helix-turn-helix transcriptional regulator [Mycobacteroides abscessus]
MTTTPEPDELRARVVQSIRQLRDDQKLSAAALADRTGGLITRDTIANLESGRKRVIDVAELIAIAKGLGVSPLSLIYPPDPDNASAALAFCGYDNDDDPVKPLYRLHDARKWYDRKRNDPDEAERLSARSSLGQAEREARKLGWAQ